MDDELDQLLISLKLGRVREILDERSAQALIAAIEQAGLAVTEAAPALVLWFALDTTRQEAAVGHPRSDR